MDFTSHDIAIIENALHFAIHNDSNEQGKRNYREVLRKLQESSQAALHAQAAPVTALDGIRYDYDDSSELS